jgi:NAD(P)H-dependent FMN reductase
MITVISGTNRKGSRCKVFAEKYSELLSEIYKTEVKILALEDLSHDWFQDAMYLEAGQKSSLTTIQDEYILPAEAFVFVIPEYNGSYPGVLKMFIDACSVRKYAENFKGKKAALVGVASGRAGNLRGMSHLAGVLHYLGATTLPNQLPISSISQMIDEKGKLTDVETISIMREHAASFSQFVS